MTLIAPQPARTPASGSSRRCFEKRARRRRRRMLLFGVVFVVVVGVGVDIGLTDAKPQPARPPATGTLPPRAAAPKELSATTAYVADASGLVPVSLATGHAGPAIAIPGYDGTANVVGAPNGQTAYVVSSRPRLTQESVSPDPPWFRSTCSPGSSDGRSTSEPRSPKSATLRHSPCSTWRASPSRRTDARSSWRTKPTIRSSRSMRGPPGRAPHCAPR